MNISFLRSKEFWWYWLPPAAWCGTVLLLSGDLGASKNTYGILKWLLSWFPLLSPAQFDLFHGYFRKTVGHFGNYGLQYFLWFRAFQGQLHWRPGRVFLVSVALCLAMALLDEGHQAFFASRGSSLWDVALDLSGSACVALFTWIFWTPRVQPAPEK